MHTNKFQPFWIRIMASIKIAAYKKKTFTFARNHQNLHYASKTLTVTVLFQISVHLSLYENKTR